ncbi:MAG: AMP-dependent synthetase [Cellvibrionaceae bacterium]|nr:AMP-dependent synthetase [Cellvibrionaceae bacterium]|tara:strand:- start:51210 stop:52730 length:1521 start_codon:yes stop_codon:yes gene_type:complete
MQPGLTERIATVVQLSPPANALEFKGTWYSWKDVSSTMAQLESLLLSAGQKQGAPIGVLLRNRPAHVACVMQLLSSRRCVVSINPFQSPEKVAADIKKLNLPVLVADTDDWAQPAIQQAAAETGAALFQISQQETLSVEAINGHQQPTGQNHHEPLPDTCILMLTSGTTGPAKRIKLPYKSFAISLMGVPGHYSSHNEQDEVALKSTPAVLTTPLVHIGGMYAAMAAITSARPIVILEKFSVDEMRRTLQAYQPKLVALPPTAIRMIYDADVPKEDLSCLLAIRMGSAPMPSDLHESFEAKYGVPLLDSYGATEFAGAVAGWTIQDHRKFGSTKRGSVGRVQPGVEMRIVDPDSGEELSHSTPGLLEVKTSQIGHSDWTRTTDLAEIDEDGFLYIRGRSDDAIIRGGFKIIPADVVTILRKHEAIKYACVVGIPDQRLGAVPVAAIQLQPGFSDINLDDLKLYLREHLTSYQIPVAFKILPEMPRTPSMKISKHDVTQLFLNERAQ